MVAFRPRANSRRLPQLSFSTRFDVRMAGTIPPPPSFVSFTCTRNLQHNSLTPSHSRTPLLLLRPLFPHQPRHAQRARQCHHQRRNAMVRPARRARSTSRRPTQRWRRRFGRVPLRPSHNWQRLGWRRRGEGSAASHGGVDDGGKVEGRLQGAAAAGGASRWVHNGSRFPFPKGEGEGRVGAVVASYGSGASVCWRCSCKSVRVDDHELLRRASPHPQTAFSAQDRRVARSVRHVDASRSSPTITAASASLKASLLVELVSSCSSETSAPSSPSWTLPRLSRSRIHCADYVFKYVDAGGN